MSVFRPRAWLAGVCLLLPAAGLSQPAASSPAVALPAVVTTATRTPADPRTLRTVVDVLTPAENARRQTTSLAAALGGVAALPTATAGAAGMTTSLFLRGANSNQTLFLVDGLRINEPNTDYAVFLGGACVGACDSLEISHGPQSTLYGGEAIGGVVALRAQRGAGRPSGRVAVEAGSFGTRQAAWSAQGESGAAAWSLSLQGGATDNERPNNRFESANVVARVDRRLGPRVAVGATARWFHGAYGSPGDRFVNDPDNTEREDNLLATAFADLTFSREWTARAMVGAQDRRFVAESPRAGRPTAFTVVKNRRAVADLQTTWSGWERHRVTAGVTNEGNRTVNTGFGAIDRRQRLFAVFAQDEFSPREDIFLTAGLRNDDFDSFGRSTTGRATAAWLAPGGKIKFRASHGTAFRSPSFLDLYGRSAFYTGNPGLRPERAAGWDAGFDALAGRGARVGVTWHETRLRDLIASTPDFRSVQNIQRAQTRGLEFSGVVPVAATEVRWSYGYLEADNLTTGRRLLRRPRHRGGVDVWHAWTGGLSAGAGVAVTAAREDVDARTFRTIDGEDFSVVRLYAEYRVNPRLSLKARVENLLGEKYEEVNGYPAPGRGAFGALEWRF
ncbi:MAG: TonB-dependent receptor plug domain-containing protein [Opitutaceae bacterium]